MSYYVSGYYQEKAILKKEGQLFFLKCEEADASLFFERFVLFFCLKIERFVPDSAEIWHQKTRPARYRLLDERAPQKSQVGLPNSSDVS